jgi:peptide/nickel transport system permease protein
VEVIVSAVASVGRRRRVWRIAGLDLVGHIALVIVVLFALLAVIGPYLAPHDPNAVNLSRAYWGPDASHPFGYDNQGRDILSRLLVGARSSFLGPLAIVLVATGLGLLLAIVGAWKRGWVDAGLAGVLDASLAYPGLLLAVMAVAIFGAGLTAIVVALGIAYTPYVARLARSVTISEMGKDYIDTLKVQGFSAYAICRRHLLPNIFPIVLAQATLTLAWATIDIAALSYLGLGIRPPAADWGVMVAEGQTGVLAGYPMQSMVAGACLVIAICSFSMLGERLLRRADEMAA